MTIALAIAIFGGSYLPNNFKYQVESSEGSYWVYITDKKTNVFEKGYICKDGAKSKSDCTDM